MGERKKFDKAFKEQVAQRIISGEMTVSKMAEELGVHYTTVRDWVRYYKRDGNNACFYSLQQLPVLSAALAFTS